MSRAVTKRDLLWLYREYAKGRGNVNLADAVADFLEEPRRCPLCFGRKTVNFEQCQGWDEPCPKCT